MTDHPIIFSGPMVRALLDGRKTQHREVLDLRGFKGFTEFGPSNTRGYDWHFRDARMRWNDLRHGELLDRLPWTVGDRLWVRENVTRFDKGTCDQHVWYRAGGNEDWSKWTDLTEGEWPLPEGPAGGAPYNVPCIHMPRWASRLTLTVTEVRVERLQDISEEDAEAEGAEPVLVPPDGGSWPHYEGFRELWRSIRGPDAWDANPWVAAITFTVEARNIGAPREAA